MKTTRMVITIPMKYGVESCVPTTISVSVERKWTWHDCSGRERRVITVASCAGARTQLQIANYDAGASSLLIDGVNNNYR